MWRKYLEDSESLFINHLHNLDEEKGKGIASFFVRKSIYSAFFGKPSPLSLERLHPRNNAVEGADIGEARAGKARASKTRAGKSRAKGTRVRKTGARETRAGKAEAREAETRGTKSGSKSQTTIIQTNSGRKRAPWEITEGQDEEDTLRETERAST